MRDHTAMMQQQLVECCAAVERQNSTVVPAEAMESFREGLAHFHTGDAGAAVSAFSQSVLRAPDFGEAHVFLGLAHALTSNIYPAFDHLERATELQPDSFAAHFTRAQLYFKLRIPAQGYASAAEAMRCAMTMEHRSLLTQLLKEERARERNGIARPSFMRPFSTRALLVAGGGLAAALVALLIHVR